MRTLQVDGQSQKTSIDQAPMTHDLKTDPTEFDAVQSGARTLDLLNANYGLGDLLTLREYLDST